MPIPSYQECMLPLLQWAAARPEGQTRLAAQDLAGLFKLNDEELTRFLPSGQQPVFLNRLGWARTYLKKAGLLRYPRRGHFQITDRGQDVLNARPPAIDIKFLERFPEFLDFRALRRESDEGDSATPVETTQSDQTPHEALELSHERLRSELASDILQALKGVTPAQFENIVVDVLVRMGYGGNRRDAARAIGRTGDEGIDGIIKEDHLGLDSIYVQAKRWEATVGRPEIQKFAGALQGQRARKGVFMTTSDFSKEAHEYVSRIESKIVLLDGRAIARMMIEFGVGVTSVAVYEVKKLDADYFAEE